MKAREKWTYQQAETNMWIGACIIAAVSMAFGVLALFDAAFFAAPWLVALCGPFWGAYCARSIR